MNRRGLCATALTLGACGGSLGAATEGLRVFTAEGARAWAVAQRPPALPRLALRDHAGSDFELVQTVQASGSAWILAFLYTRCRSLCSVLSTQLRGMQRSLQASGWAGPVQLLLISFDPLEDRPPVLARHAQRFGFSGPGWRLAVPEDAAALQPLLRTVGLQLLPLPGGEFEHNAAFHLVDAQARLRAILPLNRADEALLQASRLARPVAA